MEKVSVIMPCYNDGEYIKESIKSVKNQTYKNIELIIVDDGSTDKKTINIINNISDKHIKVFHSNHLRPAGARNFGIKKSTGKYILPVDSDDLIESTYIEKAVNILESNKNIGVVYCKADLFGEESGEWKLPEYSIKNMLLDNVVFVTALFYKEDWIKVGGFNENMKEGMEDYDFWLSILELDKEIYQIPEILFHYRIKKVSRTSSFQKDCTTVKKVYRKIYNNHPILYNKYKDLYAVILRDALIEQIFVNRNLKACHQVLRKFNKLLWLKKIIKKLLKIN